MYGSYRNYGADLSRQRAYYEANRPTKAEIGFKKAAVGGFLGASLTYAVLKIFKNDTAKSTTKNFFKKAYEFLKI